MKNNRLGITSPIAGTIISLSLLPSLPVKAEVTVADLKNLYGAELQVLGEVQQIDISKGILVVAGQHVAISKETVFSVDKVAVADSAKAFRAIQPGELLAISGPLNASAVSVDRLKVAYVPGATTIFVKGKIAAVEQSVGLAKIDELRVDLTPAMSDTRFANIEVGEVVEAIGTQPSANGALLARSISGYFGRGADVD